MLKKNILLVTAILALAAFGAPALAQAEPENWIMGESELEEENALADFTGQIKFTFGKGVASIQCKVQLRHTLDKTKSTGHVTQFNASGCQASGAFIGCTVTAAKGVNLPWVAHAASSGAIHYISITGISVNFTQTGFFCISKSPSVNGNANAFPDLFSNISSEAFSEESGTLESNFESTATLSGTLAIEGSEAGTYGMTE